MSESISIDEDTDRLQSRNKLTGLKKSSKNEKI